jgi:5-formyltetrahydrofolate cyclo-ligase
MSIQTIWVGRTLARRYAGRPLPADPASLKRALRRRMRAALRRIPAAEREQWSALACARLADTPAYRDAAVVLAFLSLPWEVDTTPLVRAALASGKTVATFRVDVARRAMTAVRLRSLEEVRIGAMGIREPGGDGEPLDAAAIDLVVTPGLAFDALGNRLGQGGGFYDRYLAAPGRRAPAVALAFDLQLLPRVPAEPHDQRVDALVTDRQFLDFRGGPRP